MMILSMFVTVQKPRCKRRVIPRLFTAITCLCLTHTSFAATDYQPLADIRQAINQHVQSRFPATVQTSTLIGQLDPRLRLKKCPRPLEAFYPTGTRKLGPTTLGVRCLGPAPWQIFVSVQVKAFGPAVVSKHALPRGTILQKSDLTLAKRELSGALQGYYTAISEIEGMQLRYSLAEGYIIGPKSLKPHHLVKQGDIVTILAETQGLLIRVKGKALMNGFRGQSIRVKNTRSNRVLQGEVIASQTVRVKL